MKKIIIAIIILALSAIALAACTQEPATDTYTVTFVDSSLGAIAIEKGASIAEPAEPQREGYIFRGWFADADFVTFFNFDAVRESDVNVYAKWALSTYTVTFADADTAAVVNNSGSPVQMPADPTKQGFVFGGWCADAACTVAFNFDAVRYENVTVYAKWDNLPPYVFTFVSLSEFFGNGDLNILERFLTDGEGNLLDGYAISAVTFNQGVDVVIPGDYNGKPVYVLGGGVFQGSDIVSVTIPASVVYVGNAAFKNCSDLEHVIYSSVTDTSIVYGWEIMEAIATAQLPIDPEITDLEIRADMAEVNNVYLTCSRLCSIGSEVFSGCSSLEELTLPPMLIFMGSDAFFECRSLVTVYVERRIDASTSGYDGPGPSSWTGTHGFSNMFQSCNRLQNIYVYLYNGPYPVHRVPKPDKLLNGVDIYKINEYWKVYAPYIKANPSGD